MTLKSPWFMYNCTQNQNFGRSDPSIVFLPFHRIFLQKWIIFASQTLNASCQNILTPCEVILHETFFQV